MRAWLLTMLCGRTSLLRRDLRQDSVRGIRRKQYVTHGVGERLYLLPEGEKGILCVYRVRGGVA